jgi:hypothetical protein
MYNTASAPSTGRAGTKIAQLSAAASRSYNVVSVRGSAALLQVEPVWPTRLFACRARGKMGPSVEQRSPCKAETLPCSFFITYSRRSGPVPRAQDALIITAMTECCWPRMQASVWESSAALTEEQLGLINNIAQSCAVGPYPSHVRISTCSPTAAATFASCTAVHCCQQVHLCPCWHLAMTAHCPLPGSRQVC